MNLFKSATRKREMGESARACIYREPYRHTRETLRSLYDALLRARLFEENLLFLRKHGKLGHWFSGLGQEAVSVGAALAMSEDEYILPQYRNLGVFTCRGVSFRRLLSQFKGKPSGFTKGRDRTFHFASHEHRIIGMISHSGAHLSLADGVALAEVLMETGRAALAICGDGTSSEGEFHEAINLAAVWGLPVIFLVENNGYAFSTPSSGQFRCRSLSERARGYGIEGIEIDGNDILEVYETVYTHAAAIRKTPRPVLIECRTFRLRPHEEASHNEFVPAEELQYWSARDPLQRFEGSLLKRGVITPEYIRRCRSEAGREIDAAVREVLAEPGVKAGAERECRDVYRQQTAEHLPPRSAVRTKKKFVQAVSEGLRQALQSFDNLVLIGNDIGQYGGAFGVTEGLVHEFGTDKVRNAPLSESAMVGAALGLALRGMKAVVEMQSADFASGAFTQIVNNLAKIHYRWGQSADVVVRLPVGGELRAGAVHSQSNEAVFMHTPGLKVVYPSCPFDAKGLLLAAIEDPNPVLFFEHKKLYRGIEEYIPDNYYNLPFGKARLIREGSDVSIITYGLGVHWALEILDRNEDIAADLLDLRTLQPLDRAAIERTVRKTGRVIILHEATITAGAGAEVAAFIAQSCFDSLDAPILRSASLDTPVPFAATLEDDFLPKGRFEQQLIDLLLY